MKNIPNKVVALVTMASWVLIFVITFIDGFLYGSPPIDSILPPIAAALIGWFAFLVTIFAIVKLYMTSDDGSNSDMMSM